MASQINLQDLYLTVNSDGTGSLTTTQPVSSISYTIVLKHFTNELITINWDKDDLSTLTTTGKTTDLAGLQQNGLFGLSSDFVGKTNTISYNKNSYVTSPKSGSGVGTGSNISSNGIIIEQGGNVYINLMNAQNAMEQNNCYSMEIIFTRGETLPTDICYIEIYGLGDGSNGNSIDIVSVDENLNSQSTTINSDCRLRYPIGQSLVLTAIPYSGYSFNEYNYTISGNNYSSTSNTLNLVLSGDTTISAKFSETQQGDPIFDNEFVTVTINGLKLDQKIRLRYTFNDNMSMVDFTKENNSNQILKGSKCDFSAENPYGAIVDWDGDGTTPASDQYNIDSIQSDVVLNVKFENTPVNHTLTINGFVDDAWKVIATPTNLEGTNEIIYEFSSQNQSISIPAGTMLILDFEKASNTNSYYSQGKLYLNNSQVFEVTMNSDITLRCEFSPLEISIDSDSLRFNIENLEGGEFDGQNKRINNILYDSTVEFDIVPYEKYIFNSYTISSNGTTQTSSDTHVIVPNIKATCSLTVALTRDNTSSDIILSDEFEEKHFRFKIKYKNVENEIWIDWNPKIYKYKYNDES